MPGHGVIPIRTQAGNPYRPCPAASTKTAGTSTPGRHRPWLALVAQATQRRTTTYDALGALLLSHPLTLRSDLDPIDDYCNQHGLPPLAVVCVDPKTGEPSRGNVGVFRLDKNRERVFNHDWFALVPPTPDEIREAHLAQNPPPTARLREPRPLPEPPKRD